MIEIECYVCNWKEKVMDEDDAKAKGWVIVKKHNAKRHWLCETCSGEEDAEQGKEHAERDITFKEEGG